MKQREITISVPKLDFEFKGLLAPDPETPEECVELCAGSDKALIQAFMAGFIVKAQSKVRGAVETNQKDDEKKLTGDKLVQFAQDQLNEYRYTGVRKAKAKKPVKVSKAALKEKGASAADIKQLDKLLALLADQGIEVTD